MAFKGNKCFGVLPVRQTELNELRTRADEKEEWVNVCKKVSNEGVEACVCV